QFTLQAEILAGTDQARAEVRLPDAVDDGSRRGGSIAGNQPFRQTKPIRLGVRRQRLQDTRNAGADRLGRPEEITAIEEERLPVHVARHHRQLRRADGMLLPEVLDLRVGFLELVYGRPPVSE